MASRPPLSAVRKLLLPPILPEGGPPSPNSGKDTARTRQLFKIAESGLHARTDGIFGHLLFWQWIASIVLAMSGRLPAWLGFEQTESPSLVTVALTGSVLCIGPMLLIQTRRAQPITRYAIAIAQILTGVHLVHLSDSSLAPQFHTFASIAFLAFYRDWRLLITATVFAGICHGTSEFLWPTWSSSFLSDTPLWRGVEHMGWIVFENIFLLVSIYYSRAESLDACRRRAELEAVNGEIESRIAQRTADLEASTHRVESILSTAYDAFVEINIQGIITEWNPQAQTTFGWQRSEALGRSLRELIYSSANRDPSLDTWKQLMTPEGPLPRRRHEFIALRRTGIDFPVEMTLWPVSSGGAWHFNAFIHDITERHKAAAEAAHARDAALESARMKSEFLANMSHEIRTPMNGVIGMLNLLSDTQLGPQQRDFTETARQSAESLLTVLNDILDFSKIEAGHLTIEETDFDLRELLESTLELLAERAQSKGLELMGSIENGTPTALRGDPTRIRQVLLNLTGNAIKFTEKGEVVVVVRSKSDPTGTVTIHFEVRDTGIGISEEALSRLFQPFAQADGSTTRKYGGTGLGLAISRRLVELMKGEIGVSSEFGAGSTFRFFTPVKHAHHLDPAPHRASVARRRVLIVDDNATNRSVLHHQLEAWDVRDGVASGPTEALVLLREAVEQDDPYSLALLDMQMPVMDGLDLARAIKSDPAISATRLVILTSLGARLDDVTRQAAGIDDWIFKPVRQKRLFDCLTRTMAAAHTPAKPVEIAKLSPKSAPAESKPIAKPPPLRILLAEDNAVNQRVALGQLSKLGYTADVVSNGRDAVSFHIRAPYDVILMDCQMPELEGFGAAEQIRVHEAKPTQDPVTRVYIIALTAHALEGDREKCLASGMDDYLTKPMKPGTLSAALTRAHEARRSRSEGSHPRQISVES